MIDVFISSAPLLLLVMAALLTEYAGIMAVFLEGIINLSAFFCFSITVFSGNIFVGICVSLLLCSLLIFLVSVFTQKTNANPFLTGLSVNLFSTGIISILSTLWFKTKGVISLEVLHASQYLQKNNISFLYSQLSLGGSFFSRGITTIVSWILVLIISLLLFYSTWGLRLRITGSNPDVLSLKGISVEKYKITSWVFASILASLAGCILTIRLQAFVPFVSSGKGWTALAAVFLGRKHPLGIIAAVLVFSFAEYGVTLLQGFSGNIATGSSTLLLALPYVIALLWFTIKKK